MKWKNYLFLFIAFFCFDIYKVNAKSYSFDVSGGVGYNSNGDAINISPYLTMNFKYGEQVYLGNKGGGTFNELCSDYDLSSVSNGFYNVNVGAYISGTTGSQDVLVSFINKSNSETQYLNFLGINGSVGSNPKIGTIGASKNDVYLSSSKYRVCYRFLDSLTFANNSYYGFTSLVLTDTSNNESINQQKETTKAIDETNNTLNDDDTSESSSSFSSFSDDDNFKDSHGLDSIIKLPLDMINTLSSSCTNISLTIPYIDKSFSLPCLSSIYKKHLGSVYDLLKIVINGFIIYRLLLELVSIIKGLQSPDSDKVEVLEL